MILVDKDIKDLGEDIIEGYNDANVGAISYDLTLDYVINNEDCSEFIIKPNEMVIIRTTEKLKMPNYLLGRVVEKNSVMRLGLFVRAPHYQPGHNTYCFLFVQNISHYEILLKKGMKIAQIIFEELRSSPQVTYSENTNSSFNNETSYIGLGNYTNEFTDCIKNNLYNHNIDRIKELVKSSEELNSLVNSNDEYIRERVAKCGYGLDKLINDESELVRAEVARQGYGLDKLVNDESWKVKIEVVKQGYGLDKLVNDENEYVRSEALEYKSLL